MGHLIGHGRYARESYPTRREGAAGANNEALRFYGGAATASAGQQTYSSTVTGDTVWVDFTQDNILQQSGKLVAPAAYLLTSFNLKRVITGGAGPIVGDADITCELLQSTDNGATWGPPGGGAAVAVSFGVNETADKSVALNVEVPANALVTVRAVYPTNYDPQGQEEVILMVVGVG